MIFGINSAIVCKKNLTRYITDYVEISSNDSDEE